ncbi:MAG: hypothetical protein WKF58_11775 [Ilumatobacteraceae bacterium]
MTLHVGDTPGWVLIVLAATAGTVTGLRRWAASQALRCVPRCQRDPQHGDAQTSSPPC